MTGPHSESLSTHPGASPLTAETRRRGPAALAGFLASVIAVGVVVGLLLRHGVLPPFFAPVTSPVPLWQRCALYLPILAFSLVSLGWLRYAGIQVRPWLGRWRWSPVLIVGLVVSAGYTVWLLTARRQLLVWDWRWAPIATLSALNAVSEEVLFRVVAPRLLSRMVVRASVWVLLSSILYASYHVPLGGVRLGALALGYGLLLGAITERTRSVWPAVICHFLVDLGAIGIGLGRRPLQAVGPLHRLLDG